MQKHSSKKMGTEPIVPLLFRLSIPSIIAMAVQAFYNVVDSIYVGRLGTDPLSALSLSFPIQMIIIAIAVGTGIGTSSLISRLLGKGNREKAANAAEHVILISLFYSIIIATIGYFLSDRLFYIFTNDQTLIRLGTEYISIILVGSIALFFPMISNNILRGEGNTFVPMVIMIVGAIINIILDPLLIFGIWIFPQLGIQGAAIATVTARFISGIILVFMLFSDKNELKIDFKSFKFDFNIIIEIYKVGFPAMIMQLLASFMLAGMNKILASYTTTAIAAAGIYFRLQSFIFMPVFGLNQGYMPIVGYNYGHNNPKRMVKTMKLAILIGFAFTLIGFILFQTIPKQLVTLFNNDPELIRIGSIALKKISIAFPIIGPAIIISTTFQAIGKGLPSLFFSFLRQIIILLPTMYLLGIYFGLDNLWYAFPISEFISVIPAAIWLRLTFKKVINDMENTLDFDSIPL
ncbi:MAG: MATE family efflux transporter [Halanaerobiales bacterium]|nr:MATE family efflux transporter [Halanaerobiales bacterium]